MRGEFMEICILLLDFCGANFLREGYSHGQSYGVALAAGLADAVVSCNWTGTARTVRATSGGAHQCKQIDKSGQVEGESHTLT